MRKPHHTLVLPLFAVACASCIFAQTATPTKAYVYCSGGSGPRNIAANAKTTLYLSDIFAVSGTSQGAVRVAYAQFLAGRDKAARAELCTVKASQQEASTDKATNLSKLQAAAQTAGLASSLQVVETGWKYEASTTAASKAPSASVKPTAAIASQTTSNLAAASQTAPAQTTASPAAAPSNAGSVGGSMAAAGTSMKQSVQASAAQSVQAVQDTTAKTAADTMDTLTKSAQDSIQQGMKKMFTRKKASPAPGQAAPSATSDGSPGAAPVTAPAGATLVHADLVTNSLIPATVTSAKPSIQEEGDGTHWLLMLPGDPDGHELTPVAGSKTVFVEDATGDKYILTPQGDVRHIPHKNAAAK